MNSKRIAHNYAAALFAIAKEQKNELGVYNDISLGASASGAEKRLNIFLENPSIAMDEKKKLISGVMKGGALSRNFFDLLVNRKMFRHLESITDEYKKILDYSQKRETVKITSAVELENNSKKAVVAKLSSITGAEVIPEFSVDPAIISGLIIRYKDRIIDASIKAQLQSIASQLTRG